jgi:hypothetical protein
VIRNRLIDSHSQRPRAGGRGKEISRKNTRCRGLGVVQCADRCASKVNQPDVIDCHAKLFAHVLNK